MGELNRRTIYSAAPSFRGKRRFVGIGLAAFLASCVTATACTPATADSADTGSGGQVVPVSSGGAQGPSGTGGASVGSGGSATMGSGGTGLGGTGIGESGGSIGTGGSSAVGSGGSAGATPGAGGKVGVATGGVTGSAGAGGSSGKGCNWIQNPDGTWAFGTPAPSDKIVLFDGTTKNGWHKQNMPGVTTDWMLLADGTLKVVPNSTNQAVEIQSDMAFEDLCVHVEYLTPMWTSNYNANVQRHGNSGVYLKGAYEMQILDTHDMGPLNDGCGAAYKIKPPLVVACNMYGIWNTYEIEFKASGWTGTTKTKNAVFVRVALNGKIVQLNTDLDTGMKLMTEAGLPDAPGPQPLGLQDHLDTVSFRNIWATVPKY